MYYKKGFFSQVLNKPTPHTCTQTPHECATLLRNDVISIQVCDWLLRQLPRHRLVAKRVCETGSRKKILSTQVLVSLCLTFLSCSPLLTLRLENSSYPVDTERPTWGASSRKNPKESHPIKTILRQQQRQSKLRRQATRFPLATTPTRQRRSSTAGIREKR